MSKRGLLLLALALSGCGSDAGVSAEPTPDAGNLEVDAGAGQPGPTDAGVVAPLQMSATVSGLEGDGLVLRTASGELIDVTADGRVDFGASSVLEIVSQPTDPHQTCSVQLTAGQLRVRCTTDDFSVRGQVTGLAGTGLVLLSSTGEMLPLSASGGFAFTDQIEDGAAYEVIVGVQPSHPRQKCTVLRGAGTIAGADVEDVAVSCTTESFHVSGWAVGLLGSGLELELEGRETLPISGTGNPTFAFTSAVPDASPFAVKIKSQPQNPAQRCVVQRGTGTLDGPVTDVTVVCGALGGLRVSEVGSCYHSNSACWFELYNAGSVPEDISYYQVRTTALRPLPAKYLASQDFALPSLALPPGGYAVVRAKSSNALPDGSGVVHVSSDGYLPWWNGTGFVELLSNGVSVDFVRFGQSTASPASEDGWTGDSAPELASGANQYGRSLARSVAVYDSDRGTDFAPRAFATPGGPNDVTSDSDTDNDGVPDQAEISGGRYAGLDLYAMGARLGQRDMFVEIDRMQSSDPAVIPRREALDSVVRAFAEQQVAVHFDAGDLFAPSFDAAAYNLGGGNVVPFALAVDIGQNEPGVADLYAYKAEHMSAARRSLFYYQLFGWSQNKDGSGGSSGIGERPGNDSIITLGGFGLKVTTTLQRNLVINYQAATMMHELGHNLGLRHGGDDDLNRKPNYVSVMNYLYSPLGLPTIGQAEGDRYDFYKRCSIFSLWQLSNPPTSDPTSFTIGFSEGLASDIDEGQLLEGEGLGLMSSTSVDFNCNGKLDGSYQRDLNDDDEISVLRDHDDWGNLDFVFRRVYSGNENGPTLFLSRDAKAREDVLTDDVQPVADVPCPGIVVPAL